MFSIFFKIFLTCLFYIVSFVSLAKMKSSTAAPIPGSLSLIAALATIVGFISGIVAIWLY